MSISDVFLAVLLALSGFLLGLAVSVWADHVGPLTPGLRDFYQEDRDHQRQQHQDRLHQLEENWLRQQLVRPNPC